nr:MAG TPA: hypothetical protein [Caudoviricetes sp.]
MAIVFLQSVSGGGFVPSRLPDNYQYTHQPNSCQATLRSGVILGGNNVCLCW